MEISLLHVCGRKGGSISSHFAIQFFPCIVNLVKVLKFSAFNIKHSKEYWMLIAGYIARLIVEIVQFIVVYRTDCCTIEEISINL